MEPRSTAKRKRPSCRRGTVVGLVTVLLLLGGGGGDAETVGPGAAADAAATSSSSAGANRRTVRAGGAAVAATTRWGRAVQGGDDGGDEGEAFASCADGREDHVCLHGGVCRPTVEDDQYRCDCSSAVDGDGTPHVGKWCHLPPQVLCDVGGGGGGNDTDTNDTETNSTDNTNDDNTGLAGHFCVNDGTCNDDGPTCDCGEDFVGVHCEYRTGEDATTEADFQGGGSGGENTGGDNTDGDNTDGDGGGGAQQQPPQGGDSSCPLQCQNGGTCGWEDGPSRAPRCECPGGYDGDLCERVATTPCGTDGGACHHGSACVRTMAGDYACDCTVAAVGGTASNNATRKFAGRWCQHEATSYCDDTHRHFCANGGTCVHPPPDAGGVVTCRCDDPRWTGPSCEFEGGDSEGGDADGYNNNEACTLRCLNGGECRKGAKEGLPSSSSSPPGGGGGDGGAATSQPSGVFDENFEHCACPEGYTGLACEHRYDVCGDGEHFCLHGSRCVAQQPLAEDEGGGGSGNPSKPRPPWTCDCGEALGEDGPSHAGEFCQHHRTVWCTTEAAGRSVYHPPTSAVFCVNDGTCTQVAEGGSGELRPACSCPAGYTGAHCELLQTPQAAVGGEGSSIGVGMAAVVAIFSVLGTLLAVLLIRRYLRWKIGRSRTLSGRDGIIATKKLDKGDANRGQTAIMMEEADFDPDFDERDLEEVELL